jgi:hypothetical protein
MAINHAAPRWRAIAREALAEATGRVSRGNAVLAGSGGPAGNARLTAWTGLVLLVLFAAELVTLIDVRQLISWHLALGALLVPPALLKTASTGWRILRYYAGDRPYRDAGAPPLLLRVLGPLVVLTTLALLGSGLALVAVGPNRGRGSLVDLLGLSIDILTVHQTAFAVWAAVTGLHLLTRLVPALRLTVGSPASDVTVPGGYRRIVALLLTAVAAVALAVVVVKAGSAWHDLAAPRFGSPGQQSPPG